MAISQKIRNYAAQASWIRRMFEEGINLKKQYGCENVFDFSLGNPNAPPPELFREQLLRIMTASEAGLHGYTPNAGHPEARKAVATTLCEAEGMQLSAEHVVMTCGAGGALNVIFKALLDPGDEVLVPAPYFVEYPFYVDNASGVTKFVATRDDFSLDLEAIGRAITDRTKVVLINSPNNPTGRVYDEKSIRGLGSLLMERSLSSGRDLYLVSDEPYAEIVYDNVKVPSVLSSYRNSIKASSYSKSLSLPGERIGYIAVNPEMKEVEELMGALILCNRILGFVNAPALMQKVISCLQGVKVNVAEYERKRSLLCDGLSSLGYSFRKPEGAFYLFPRSPITDDVEFVRLLQKRRILTVPGTGFGGPGYFRIAYCVDDATIMNAMGGFKEAIDEASNR
ncbi:MAG: pyridoxal phosphate-dependent aminotransferase [Smithellaceae bacterium]|nr:pyridoxal phosphate-dependent aminotransferase [Smithellaceae bacterium]